MLTRSFGLAVLQPLRILESLKRTALTLDHFLVFSGRRPPLRSDHATVRTYDHICRILLKQAAEIDVSESPSSGR